LDTKKGGEAAFDGDSRPVKGADLTSVKVGGIFGSWTAVNSYTIYSSVTGQKISELNEAGASLHTFVYVGDKPIARRDGLGIKFKLKDPVTGSERNTDDDGVILTDESERTELAGLGMNVPFETGSSLTLSLGTPNYKKGGYIGDAEDGCGASAMEGPGKCSEILREKSNDDKKEEGAKSDKKKCKKGEVFWGYEEDGITPICSKRIKEKAATVKGQDEPDPTLGPGIPFNIKIVIFNITRRPECAQRLNAMATALSRDAGALRNVPTDSTLAEATYKSLGKIEIDPSKMTSPKAVGTLRDGNVYLVPIGQPTELGRAATASQRIIQEMVHGFKKSGTYSDKNLDDAALSIMSAEEKAAALEAKEKAGKNYDIGSIGHSYVNPICRVSDYEAANGIIGLK
jgi:hypothetical protein